MQPYIEFISNHSLLSIIWVCLLVAAIVMTIKNAFSQVKALTNTDITHIINNEDGIILDIRNQEEFRKGHIVNSVNLTLNQIKTNSLGSLSQKKEYPIIIACSDGLAAKTAAQELLKIGFKKVFTLKQGIAGWSNQNLPLVQGKK